ncbi:MAG: EamA family transporter RarD [Roseiflexaceae bacterium]|nr:EamA family transporter RarD [Roseiflexaceae bacterium]
MNKGLFYAAGAYILWGLLPVYWKALSAVSPAQILAHRVVWALLVALVLVVGRGKWRWLAEAARSPRTLLTFLATATLISVNWGIYIWAVNSGHVVETSLGYFINPLVSVLLGVVMLGERLRFAQGIAIGLAAAAVIYLTVQYGTLPWISLTLAFSFGLYGLLRKTAKLDSLEGFSLETLLLFVPALGFLLLREQQGQGAFLHTSLQDNLLLMGSGIATAVPLLLFAGGARRIRLSTLGLLQYIAPTLQFLLGVLVYGEALSSARLFGFVMIWLALVIYSAEGLWQNRSTAPQRLRAEG